MKKGEKDGVAGIAAYKINQEVSQAGELTIQFTVINKRGNSATFSDLINDLDGFLKKRNDSIITQGGQPE